MCIRDRYIGTYDVDGITNADLIKAMVGREINDLFPKPEVKFGDEMLRIEHLSRIGFFKDVSFNVHAGEIVGLTGLVGAGPVSYTHLLRYQSIQSINKNNWRFYYVS